MVGAVHGIGQGLDGAIHNATADGIKQVESNAEAAATKAMESSSAVTEYTHIPLKDPNKADEHLQEFKENLLKKAQSFSEENTVDKMADDLMRDTDELMANNKSILTSNDDADDGAVDLLVNNNEEKTPTHSLDSLKTTSPEPEIEKALANDESNQKRIPSPEPTMREMSAIKSTTTMASDEQQWVVRVWAKKKEIFFFTKSIPYTTHQHIYIILIYHKMQTILRYNYYYYIYYSTIIIIIIIV